MRACTHTPLKKLISRINVVTIRQMIIHVYFKGHNSASGALHMQVLSLHVLSHLSIFVCAYPRQEYMKREGEY